MNTNFNQISTIINALAEQATGAKQITPTNDAEFMSVATLVYKTGYDKIMGAITDMVYGTFFANRPYKAKFDLLSVDAQKWGAIARKINLIDGDLDNDPHYELEDGISIDMYTVKLPKALQFNFYGSNVFKKYFTVTTDQLDTAFTGSAQFAEFMAYVFQNSADVIEQGKESVRRATVANAIGALKEYETVDPDGKHVFHLLTEYNAETGLSLTKTDARKPENYKAFIGWLSARIQTIRNMMSERSLLFHVNVDGKPIMRHSDIARQRMFMYTKEQTQIDAMALANTRNPGYVPFAGIEYVNYWQSITDPDTIKVTPAVLDKEDGTVKEGDAVEVSDIFGIIFDEDFMGVTTVNTKTINTPINANGLYYNVFNHFTERYWTDYTENACLLLLD